MLARVIRKTLCRGLPAPATNTPRLFASSNNSHHGRQKINPQRIPADRSPGIMNYSEARPLRKNLLYESFSVHASGPKPISHGAFHPALSNTSDVSLL